MLISSTVQLSIHERPIARVDNETSYFGYFRPEIPRDGAFWEVCGQYLRNTEGVYWGQVRKDTKDRAMSVGLRLAGLLDGDQLEADDRTLRVQGELTPTLPLVRGVIPYVPPGALTIDLENQDVCHWLREMLGYVPTG